MHISPDRGRLAAWIALPLAVVASGAVIASASSAAFTARTENAGNAWKTGHVQLTDDHQGSALFDVSGLTPGASGEQCITVTSNSSVDSTVTMFTKDSGDDNALAQKLDVSVAVADAGTDCADVTGTVFTGTLSELMAKQDSADGIAKWDTGTTKSERIVRIGYALSHTADNTTQDLEAGTTFVWEAVSK